MQNLFSTITILALLTLASLAAVTFGGCAAGQLDAATALELADAPADAEVEARPGDARQRLEAVARANGAVVTCPEGMSFCEVEFVIYEPAEQDEVTVIGADSAFTVVEAQASSVVTVRSVGSDHLVWSWSDPPVELDSTL